ncbi:hypothetical protein LIA77_05356 [Sarocladium implicatum]|nr:hypothetical protein LIA77_05356 [Sarocladium implicatum]
MSENAVNAEALPSPDEVPSEAAAVEQHGIPEHNPSSSSPEEETRDEGAKTPTTSTTVDSDSASNASTTDSKPKTSPKPATVEDAPDDASTLGTQTPESPSAQEAHLTPKLSVHTSTPPSVKEDNAIKAESSVLPEAVVVSPPLTHTESNTVANEAHSTQPPPSRPAQAEPGSGSTPLAPISALSFLDADSPPVTKEAIRQSALNAARRGHPSVYNASPSASNHSSVASMNYSNDVFSQTGPGTESVATWSPSGSHGTKMEGLPPRQHFPPDLHRSWTAPDGRIPPGPMSHVGVTPTQQNFPPHSPFSFNGQVPLSGYQLLASKLAGDVGGVHVKPIYRRFEVLNHRLLLSIQDEICDLEEQLNSLDSADTQNRTYPGGIYPASLRQEALHNGDLYWRKRDILAKIGHRLWQYNKLLISFRDTTDLPAPTLNDVQDYRAFLSSGGAIAVEETEFLGASSDLITLDEAQLRGTDQYSEDLLTPMPRSATEQEFPIQLKSASGDADKAKAPFIRLNTPGGVPKQALPPTALAHLVFAVFVAVLVPIFTFAVIPDFAGRITVVVLVASSVLSMLLQTGLMKLLAEEKGVVALLLCGVGYSGVMATAAATFH